MAHNRHSGTFDLSVVVPVFNERESLNSLYKRICTSLEPLNLNWELIFVDDGSSDGSLEVLDRLADLDPRIRVLECVRNFGQTAALSAGFDHAEGEIVVSLDADLQNDPTDIPRVLSKLDEGFDLVSCWRQKRRDPWLTRVLPSQIANWIISRVSGVHLHDFGCTLKGYRSEILQHIHLYGEMHRFIPVYASWAGARVAELPVRHHSREHGRSKYGMVRTFKVLLDLITVKFLGNYSTKPMYLFGGLGFFSFLLGFMLSLATLYQKFADAVKAHRNPLLLLSILCFIVGVQFILFGLVAELITRIYHEAQNKPTYLLRKREPDPSAEGPEGNQDTPR